MSGLWRALPLSLGMTLLLEASFFLLCGKRDKKDLLLCLLLNVLTNPAVVLLYHAAAFLGMNRPGSALLLELSAILAEGWGYRRYGRDIRRPYLFSLGANLFSYGVGLLLQLCQTGQFPGFPT